MARSPIKRSLQVNLLLITENPNRSIVFLSWFFLFDYTPINDSNRSSRSSH